MSHPRTAIDDILTFSQTNILVNGDGHVRIAGLGSASILSVMSAVDIDRSSRSATPELIDLRRWVDTGTTMADDVYAFGFVVWEVRMELMASFDNILNGMGFVFRFSLGEVRFLTVLLPQGSIRC